MSKSEKKSFVLFHDIRKPLELLTDSERGQLLTAILDYSEFGIEPSFEGALGMAFAFIKISLDRNNDSWNKIREVRAEAGRKGGKQKQENQANATFANQTKQNVANQAVSVNDSVNVSGSVIVSSIDDRAAKLAVWLDKVICDRTPNRKASGKEKINKSAEDFQLTYDDISADSVVSEECWEEMKNILIWSVDDEFWSPIILNGAAFRKNYEKLRQRYCASSD